MEVSLLKVNPHSTPYCPMRSNSTSVHHSFVLCKMADLLHEVWLFLEPAQHKGNGRSANTRFYYSQTQSHMLTCEPGSRIPCSV